MKNKVYTLSCNRDLTKKEFLQYFEKKFLYTFRKFGFEKGILKIRKSSDVNTLVLVHLWMKLNRAFKFVKTPNVDISSLDDFAEKILIGFMNKKFDLKKLFSKKITPFYLLLDKEIELYAKLNNLKFSKKKRSDIMKWLDQEEQVHLEIKNAIVNSLLKIQKYY
ncbi:MAG: hypothetical protein ABH817_00405 [archaeon]